MAVEINSWSVSTKEWDRAGIEIATPVFAVKHESKFRLIQHNTLISTQSLYMVDRPHIWEGNRGRADNHLGRAGKVWRNRLSPTRVGYRKSDQLLFLNMFKNISRSEPVGPRSSWSSEGPLKVFLSRLPVGALFYPRELSHTLRSSVCRWSCLRSRKELIFPKYNSKI